MKRAAARSLVLYSALGTLLAVTTQVYAAGQTYGPVHAKESLSQIAYALRPEKTRLCTYQTITALYRANPDAFAGSPEHIRPGSVLRVPEAQDIVAIPAAEAYAVYHAATEPPAHAHAAAAAAAAPTDASAALPRPMPRPELKSEVAMAPPPAAMPTTAPVASVPDIRRRTGEQRRVPGDTEPLPDPNRMGRLAPVAAPEAWKEWEIAPIPDRWRLLNTLGLVPQHWYDPYNQNTWKADKPIRHGDEFLSLNVIADTLYEYRRLPVPVGPQGSNDPNENGIFGGQRQTLFNANLILSAVYIKGDTTFKPPEYELHLTPVLNYNYTTAEEAGALNIDPGKGRYRSDQFIGLQEAFVDYHLRNVSDRYDFDSVRFGIQPFSTDFRGFLFQDNQLALRFFGTRDNNRWQYNVAWIRRLEKNTNSGLNDVQVKPRNDDTYVFNLYRQDFPVLAFTSQLTVVHNRNRENGEQFYDDNGFLQRPAAIGTETPRKYQVTYFGYNGDGHFGRLNLTMSTYLSIGRQDRGVFADNVQRIRGKFGAAEASYDLDWLRLRASAVYASGDHNPYNNTATGFDAIFENPIIAGADTSFWIRQAVPLIGGGGVTLSQRNGELADLRSSKDFGQSNFENPGLILLGLGADADLMPQLRLSGNFNHLWFDSAQTVALARNQELHSNSIGWDLSTALIYRPFFTQNIIFRLSGAMLIPDDGYRALFPDKYQYSVLGNLVLTY
ncbi:FimV/HubP family polar landmark protein [Nevskia soli]|uniref:FimV/HubP family polar landmark protein n=1 Tax=Nevskia soli TaxID=418856 RepID=UPI000689A876|nr:FimV/HubP family polar landmark protein [Nevskia soli]